MKIDIFNHIFPKSFFNKMVAIAPNAKDIHKRVPDRSLSPEKGTAFIRWTIEIIDSLEISPEDRYAIYEGNARRLLKLK